MVKNPSLNPLFKELQSSLLSNQFAVEVPSLQLIGTCHFTESKDDILCKELYKNSYNSFLMQFSDRILTIKKDNNQPLHEFHFESDKYPLQSSHLHICSSDTYFCAISIFSVKHFVVEYNVYGINKNYSLIKRYFAA